MGWSINPFTGRFEFITRSGESVSILFDEFEDPSIDQSIVTGRVIDLGAVPIPGSETFYLNGLSISSTCYDIVGQDITINASVPIAAGDSIIIKFATI